MNHKHLQPARDNDNILDQLENVKDVLHAVDDDIEGILSQPIETGSPPEIPVLSDVVDQPPLQAGPGTAQPVDESSADDQLSLTNRYRILEDRDLERAAEAEQPTEPQPTNAAAHNAPSEPEPERPLDEIDLAAELALTDIEGDPTAFPPPDQSILPDIDQLDADLGVDPLPLEQDKSPASAPQCDGDDDLPDFNITTSSRFELADAGSVGIADPAPAPTDASAVPTLTAGQLSQIIEEVLDSHMLSLQQALLERLAPYVHHDD